MAAFSMHRGDLGRRGDRGDREESREYGEREDRGASDSTRMSQVFEDEDHACLVVIIRSFQTKVDQPVKDGRATGRKAQTG
jgi:hypothetical protein